MGSSSHTSSGCSRDSLEHFRHLLDVAVHPVGDAKQKRIDHAQHFARERATRVGKVKRSLPAVLRSITALKQTAEHKFEEPVRLS